MTLIPHKNETLVLPITCLQVISRLSLLTQPASLTELETRDEDIRFNGFIGKDSFRLSMKVNYPQNYLPMMKGRIETSSRGCIIFLKYRLFFSSLMFFSFWTIMTLLIGLFFILINQEYLYATIALASGAINYLVTVLNFNKQVKASKQAICEALKIAA